MKKIDIENLSINNDYKIDQFIKGVKREMRAEDFVKIGKVYMIKETGVRISEYDYQKALERDDYLDFLEEITANDCQKKKVEKRRNKKKKVVAEKVEEPIEEVQEEVIEEAPQEEEVSDEIIEETETTI